MRQENGGPAFPRTEIKKGVQDAPQNWQIENVIGMSLRDWFAAMAITAAGKDLFLGSFHEGTITAVAERAYEIADAMLKARGQ